jgi:hypothetical protein
VTAGKGNQQFTIVAKTAFMLQRGSVNHALQKSDVFASPVADLHRKAASY